MKWAIALVKGIVEIVITFQLKKIAKENFPYLFSDIWSRFFHSQQQRNYELKVNLVWRTKRFIIFVLLQFLMSYTYIRLGPKGPPSNKCIVLYTIIFGMISKFPLLITIKTYCFPLLRTYHVLTKWHTEMKFHYFLTKEKTKNIIKLHCHNHINLLNH